MDVIYTIHNVLTTLSQWNMTRYPVWALLARNYLPVLSVSSEHAFSSAGITISKRHNRLKPDIVEALQFLKCLHHQELIYQEEPSTILEMETETAAQACIDTIEGSGELSSWDDLVEDLEDNNEEVFIQDVT